MQDNLRVECGVDEAPKVIRDNQGCLACDCDWSQSHGGRIKMMHRNTAKEIKFAIR
jgi:hypothetical protein